MALYSQLIHPNQRNEEKPCVVLLHGLLGSGEDWDSSIISMLGEHYPILLIDLPGHGKSQCVDLLDAEEGKIGDTVNFGFEQSCQLIIETLQETEYQHFIIVGYSLGGRLAMYLSHLFDIPEPISVQGICVEGGHIGLDSKEERAQRWKNDELWAQRFEQQPITDVLSDWYQQSVFSLLSVEQKKRLIKKRSGNHGASIASMLRATSLAKQPYLLDALQQSNRPLLYICGEKDEKFQRLAEQSQLRYQVIAQAGHNTHIEQPIQFAKAVVQFLERRLC